MENMSHRAAEKALHDLIAWHANGNEQDAYPYFKDFFCTLLGYPKDKVRINDSGSRGFPDITLYSKEGIPPIRADIQLMAIW
jgi:hypothetical protein